MGLGAYWGLHPRCNCPASGQMEGAPAEPQEANAVSAFASCGFVDP